MFSHTFPFDFKNITNRIPMEGVKYNRIFWRNCSVVNNLLVFQ